MNGMLSTHALALLVGMATSGDVDPWRLVPLDPSPVRASSPSVVVHEVDPPYGSVCLRLRNPADDPLLVEGEWGSPSLSWSPPLEGVASRDRPSEDLLLPPRTALEFLVHPGIEEVRVGVGVRRAAEEARTTLWSPPIRDPFGLVPTTRTTGDERAIELEQFRDDSVNREIFVLRVSNPTPAPLEYQGHGASHPVLSFGLQDCSVALNSFCGVGISTFAIPPFHDLLVRQSLGTVSSRRRPFTVGLGGGLVSPTIDPPPIHRTHAPDETGPPSLRFDRLPPHREDSWTIVLRLSNPTERPLRYQGTTRGTSPLVRQRVAATGEEMWTFSSGDPVECVLPPRSSLDVLVSSEWTTEPIECGVVLLSEDGSEDRVWTAPFSLARR
ncbi:MAG: hypothetical protein ACF8XB_13635 [Planctomycetota bacterium JB042]